MEHIALEHLDTFTLTTEIMLSLSPLGSLHKMQPIDHHGFPICLLNDYQILQLLNRNTDIFLLLIFSAQITAKFILITLSVTYQNITHRFFTEKHKTHS
ncbi:hypothetical protein CKY01_17685 [Photorhabdus laumondii subsp. clarkei]|uniref:Uncharacterized protein n=1 Tax=Photorhabdus laumondii subsp. clarkei TaxID=2029685 RepID=A0A329VB87_9GAMM|nr:hypothetical protein CKY01_17685 [Photorhabdus laumondii subsp. clarkei]